MSVKYRRVLIKISGEALAGEKGTGYDFSFVSKVCEQIKIALSAGAQIGIVIGGGNFWRGVKDGAGKVERVSADRMGMLATAMNCLAVSDVLRQCGVDARVKRSSSLPAALGTRFSQRIQPRHSGPLKLGRMLSCWLKILMESIRMIPERMRMPYVLMRSVMMKSWHGDCR